MVKIARLIFRVGDQAPRKHEKRFCQKIQNFFIVSVSARSLNRPDRVKFDEMVFVCIFGQQFFSIFVKERINHIKTYKHYRL